MEGGFVMPSPGEEDEWMEKVTKALAEKKVQLPIKFNSDLNGQHYKRLKNKRVWITGASGGIAKK